VKAYRQGAGADPAPEAIQGQVDRMMARGRLTKVRNISRYHDEAGLLAAEVLRYEDLQVQFEALLRRLGVAAPPVLPHAKRAGSRDRLDVRGQLRPDQIATINRLFRREFTEYGYPMIKATGEPVRERRIWRLGRGLFRSISATAKERRPSSGTG
jgi:hypothetical protein